MAQLIYYCVVLHVVLLNCVMSAKINKIDSYYRQTIDSDDSSQNESDYKIGFGISDITGPAAEINMMGYAKIGQDTRGIHTRLYSRALIINDKYGNKVCYVNVDLTGVTQIVKLLVMQKLKTTFGNQYQHDNVLITATHTHSGPGGYFQYLMYIITQEGFIRESLDAVVTGITKSIERAHMNLTPGHIYFNEGLLLGASINRSPASYLQNPEQELDKYKYNTDKIMQVLKFTDVNGHPLGLISWFAVHGTSMNNSNKLISGDNKGYASMDIEQKFNGYVNMGKGPFVAIFSQSNEGDSSPNIKGPRCIDTGLPCDFLQGTCNGRNDLCIAVGPGKDMFESTKIIGEMQSKKAMQLFESAKEQITGPIQFVYQNINMTQRTVNKTDGTVVKTCAAAIGYSFAAGTMDGAGSFMFHQGTVNGNESQLWDILRNMITKPSKEILECHKPKAVLLPVGEMKFPYQWVPEIIPTQILKIGNLVVAGLPAEFTTMSGRRIRNDLHKVFAKSDSKVHIILAGLANTYSNYVVTFEEYQIQRYEGGSTLFGPYTLDAYREQFKFLARSLISKQKIPSGPEIPNLLASQITLKPGVIFDSSLNDRFGDVFTDALEQYRIGTRVKVRFCGANPRNNMRLDGTYLTVEKLETVENGHEWKVVATDAHWETMFIWHRNSTLFGTSEVTILWDIPLQTEPGIYRIQYFGDSRNIVQQVKEFVGTTRPFKVVH